jgi:hypothetical protein
LGNEDYLSFDVYELKEVIKGWKTINSISWF